MTRTEMRRALIQHLSNLEEQEALAIVRTRLDDGDDPLTIIEDAQEGMRQIDAQVCEYVGADYWVRSAMDGILLFQKLLAGSN